MIAAGLGGSMLIIGLLAFVFEEGVRGYVSTILAFWGLVILVAGAERSDPAAGALGIAVLLISVLWSRQ